MNSDLVMSARTDINPMQIFEQMCEVASTTRHCLVLFLGIGDFHQIHRPVLRDADANCTAMSCIPFSQMNIIYYVAPGLTGGTSLHHQVSHRCALTHHQ